MEIWFILPLGIIAFAIFFWIVPVGLFIQALLSGAPVGILALVGMRLRSVNPKAIVDSRIAAVKAGLPLSTNQLETHYLARGNVARVVQALISADKANINLSFERACAIDLAGRDVLEAVKMTVNPKVITCPLVAAVAKDGIQLKAVARVTVRANIEKLVGGAGEETIVARVGEGVVSTIGSSDTHKLVLENPDRISKTVLQKGLDVGTAYEILSIDIADVDVGENIGAKLQTDQAVADKNIAQARAESRRAMAVATEQEMVARAQEMRAKVIEAEALVPMALSESLKQGKMGVMDFYNMKNLMADTAMRQGIAGQTKDDNPDKG